MRKDDTQQRQGATPVHNFSLRTDTLATTSTTPTRASASSPIRQHQHDFRLGLNATVAGPRRWLAVIAGLPQTSGHRRARRPAPYLGILPNLHFDHQPRLLMRRPGVKASSLVVSVYVVVSGGA